MTITKTTEIVVDTYEAVYIALAKYVLEHAPIGLIERHRSQLACHVENDRIDGSQYLDFKREDQGVPRECTLSISPGWTDRDQVEDADGTRWYCEKLEIQINYPAHGSADARTVMLRADLLREISAFAMMLEVMFLSQPIYRQLSTKVEREQAKAANQLRERHDRVVALAEKNTKGLAVGAERVLPLDAFTSEDHGRYLFTQQKNGVTFYYELRINQNTGVGIVRRNVPPVTKKEEV